MPYNEIDIDGQYKVEGHKYILGTNDANLPHWHRTTFTSSSKNYTFVSTIDGVFIAHFTWSVPAGNYYYVSVNDLKVDQHFVISSNTYTSGDTSVPVKNGDKITVYTTANAGECFSFVTPYR